VSLVRGAWRRCGRGVARRVLPLALLAGCVALPGGAAAAAAPPGSATATATPPALTALHPAAPAAPTRAAGGISLASLGWTTQTVSGHSPTIDVDIPGPDAAVFGPGTLLRLVYSRSPLLDARRSSLSVFVNGIGVGGRRLAGGAGAQVTLTVRVPASALLAGGNNHVQLAFALHDGADAGTGRCDPDPALNATVYDSSSLRYDVRDVAPFRPDLARLPAPFVSPAVSAPATVAVGLPETPTAPELDAAGRVLARLGEDAPSAPPTVTVASAPSIAAASRDDNLLLLGTPRDNAAISAVSTSGAGAPVTVAGGLWRDARGAALPAETGLILEAPNPWNRRRAALIVTANGAEGIRRAAAMLGSATLRRLLHGAFALVPAAPALPPERPVDLSGASLAALGYASTTMEGAGEHDTNYSLDLAGAPRADGRLDLSYAYGATALAGVSSVRLDLNGQPLASRALDEAGGSGARARWTIALPRDLLRAGPNVVTARFFLQAARVGCVDPPYNSLWASVDAASSITAPSMPRMPGQDGAATSVDLGRLPYPLVADGSPARSLIVVPGRVEDQRGALNWAVLLGARSRVDAPALGIVSAETATLALLRGRDVVLDGLPSTNALVARVRARLPLGEDPALNLSGVGGSLRATAQDGVALGLVEQVAAPWDARQTVLVLSATDPALLPLARRAALAGGLTGTAATVDAQGRAQSFDTRGQATGEIAVAAAPRPIRQLTLGGLGLVGLLSVAGAARRRGKRRRP